MYTENKPKRGRPKKTAPDPKETPVQPQETVPGPKETPANTLPNPMADRLYRNNHLQTIGLDENFAPANNFNSRMIRKNLKIMQLPAIALTDADAVSARITEYFQIEDEAGFKPSVAGLANSLGLDRRRLIEIVHGLDRRGNMPYNLPQSVSDTIKRAYKIMEQNWEDYMQQGQINPVTGIFLGKNNYAYQDKTEYVLTPNQPASEFSEKQLLERYGISDSDSSGDSETVIDS